jgi:hypothetical protein
VVDRSSIGRAKQHADIAQQGGNLVIYRAPDQRMIDEVVTVDEGRGIANVVKQLGRFRLHKRAVASCSPIR